MNPKILFLLGFMLSIFYAIAQPQATGALTIFSEDGDKFFLILNGERQNNTAQTNLRVEDLPQPYYNAKVIFEDKTLGEISKNMLMIADVDNVMSDVAYKIKKDKNNGKLSLKYFSSAPIQTGFIAPTNVYVMHYGNPGLASGTSVTQTTTTTTTGVGNTAAVNVNVGGVGVGMTITDPMLNGTVETSTTHTTTTTTGGAVIVDDRTTSPARSRGCRAATAMSATDFASALATIKKQGFDETKLSTAKQIAGGNCLSAAQVSEICKGFGFEETKLSFAKYAYERCTEPNNYFKVNNVFGFSSSVDDLNEYIQGKQ
ncbi:MAG: DUF4476 domain-containing protein [Bacteroidetes bacterium]|nr:DUF4476 domain-containing protein [Bacteroidota bacterium]